MRIDAMHRNALNAEWQRVRITGAELDDLSIERVHRIDRLRTKLYYTEQGRRYIDHGTMLLCTSLRRDRLPD